MFQIAKFVIIKPVRVELGALMVWDLFQPSILAIFSAFNGSSPICYHLLHLHLSLYTVTSQFVPFAKAGSTGCKIYL